MLLGVGPAGPVPGRRVVVTGLGVLACCGLGVEAFWEGLLRPWPGGERRVPDFDPAAYFGPKEVRRVDRFAQLSVAAADMALADAGSLQADPAKVGVVFATGIGGLATLEEQIEVHRTRGPRRVSPFLITMMMPNAGAGSISIRHGFRGPCETIATACAAGTHAIAAAARLVASGRCDAAVGGGAEAAMTDLSMAAFTNMTALSASGVCRPFDARRDGFAMAEGAGALVLEELDHARRRGARIYAEVLGAASTADAHHITAPSPGGEGAAACIELTLADAQLAADEVGHVNAHGTGTPLNDLAEAQAIAKVFGTPGPPVTSTKGVTGHALGGAGAIEAVASVLTLDRHLIPPTAGCEEPDPEIPLDVVRGEPRAFEPAPVLSNSFGFGGHNGCLLFGPPPAG
ncbi:beta-ketoacyl-[acyl-carrier-protein] synthase family protein [Aciditerrimonas ferrireducens]|jgi:3-oxoacyl-[acyl-carrier-protein] synthase II|uniref:Beta-ketoacyl-[acyl-carrier-protein] synthase family protein n=1 Tax=Aciditerrimonas ferrireducens TaxID=667306 RepID=A0ABV6C3C2_9ACTN